MARSPVASGTLGSSSLAYLQHASGESGEIDQEEEAILHPPGRTASTRQQTSVTGRYDGAAYY
jgi:hypothetical protein